MKDEHYLVTGKVLNHIFSNNLHQHNPDKLFIVNTQGIYDYETYKNEGKPNDES